MDFDFYNWFLVFIRTGAFLLGLNGEAEAVPT